MKRIIYPLILIILFTGCMSATKKSEHKENKIVIYTSFYPMYDFAKKIGGNKIELINMLPSGQETHDWEPKPSDIVGLENADMFIYSGVGMEPWVEKVLPTLKTKSLIVLEAAQGLELIDGAANNRDPHVWLSVKNAKQQMENIKNALVAADINNAAFYEENYEAYSKKFDELDEEFRNTLLSMENKMLVVSHKAFGYLCNDYGLEQIGIQGLVPDSEPSPARMAEIIEFVKENNVSVIFFEQSASPKVSEIIAKQTGAKTDMLSTLESLSDTRQSAGEDYLSVMRSNLEAIVRALK